MFRLFTQLIALATVATSCAAQTLGEYWDTAEEESRYYRIVEIPFPDELAIESGCFEVLDEERLAIGTRRGEIYLCRRCLR